MNLVESSELGPRIKEYHLLVRKGKTSVRKLKKKPFSPVENADRLKGEVCAVVVILSALDDSLRKMTQEMAKLYLQQAYQLAKGLVKAQGFNVEGVEPPDFDQIKERVVQSFELSVLIAMSVALSSLLDPLEATTRYPDSSGSSFDEDNSYVANFENLSKAIDCILEKAKVCL